MNINFVKLIVKNRKNKNQDNILVIAAHPDDEILGFGGTGAVLLDKGETVQPIILCGQVLERSKRPESKKLLDDMKKANKVIGFNEPIIANFPNLSMNTISSIEIVKFIEQQLINFQPVLPYGNYFFFLTLKILIFILLPKHFFLASRCFRFDTKTV